MIQIFSHTEVGGHSHNEDAFEVGPHPSDPGCFLCALADGQGGQAGGARASQLACHACIEAASAHQPAILANRPDAWEAIMRQADAAVANNPDGGFTTLIAFALRHDVICGASNGDSGAYAVSAGEPGAILTERQHKNPPIGCGGASPVGFIAPLKKPWTVLVLSDGVWKYAGWERVADAASRLTGQAIVDMLRKQAGLLGSGRLQDDFTIVGLFTPIPA